MGLGVLGLKVPVFTDIVDFPRPRLRFSAGGIPYFPHLARSGTLGAERQRHGLGHGVAWVGHTCMSLTST